MMDRARLEIDRIEGAEGGLDIGQRLIVAHTVRRHHFFRLHRGVNDIEAVQHGFGGDAVGLAPE